MSSLTDMLATYTKTRNMCQFQEKVKVISQLWLEVLRVGGKRNKQTKNTVKCLRSGTARIEW